MNFDKMPFAELCDMLGYTPKGRPLSTPEAAEVLQVRPDTLVQNRSKGAAGPRYFRPAGSRKVLYSERDLLIYIASGARMNTSEQVARYVAPTAAQQTA